MVASKKVTDDPGSPCGLALSAATSIWFPTMPKRIFEYLQDEIARFEWDILTNDTVVKEVTRIANGHQQRNYISLLAVTGLNPKTNGTTEMMIIQEGCSDATGAYVIYAPVSFSEMSMVLQGSDPYLVPLLPSGFAITHDGPYDSGGSILTISFQILADSSSGSAVDLSSTTTFNNLISCVVDRIKTALL